MSQSQSHFFISLIFNKAWRIFKKRALELYGLFLLPILVAFLYVRVAEMQQFQSIAGWLGIGYMLLQYFIGAAVYKATLNIVRSEKIMTGAIIRWTAKNFISFLLGILLYVVIVAGGLLLFVIPGLIWSIKYAFIPLLIIDKGVGPREAMRRSAKMTDSVKWDIVGFYLAVFVVMYSGFLALFVGIIVTMPFGILATYLFYDRLTKRIAP